MLPLNPQGFGTPNVRRIWRSTRPSAFVTNTNWQAYSGESTFSYLVQMAALTVQNFASAAAGIAIAIALVRGFARQQMNSLGNFWVDLTRADAYILLPLSVVAALFLLLARRDPELPSLHDGDRRWKARSKRLRKGPVASQEAIKMLGTNGGGFFNANSSHPFENPTPLTNFLQMILDLHHSGRAYLHVRRHGRR